MKWISGWLAILLLVLSLAVSTKSGSEGTESSSASRPVQSSSKPQAVSSVEEPEPVNIALPVDIAPGWEDLYPVMYSMSFFSAEFKSKYVKLDGSSAFEFECAIGSPYTEGVACVMVYDEEMGYSFYYINAKGEKQFGINFDYASNFNGGRAAVNCKDDRWRVIDIENNAVYTLSEEVVWAYNEYSDGMLYVRNADGECGYYDEFGRLTVPMQWGMGSMFKEGLAAVVNDKETMNYIDKSGKVVLKTDAYTYNWLYDFERYAFSEGLAYVDGGYIDKSGKEVLQLSGKLEGGKGGPFSEGLATVYVDESGYYVIDKAGRIVIDALPYWVGEFHDGVANISDGELEYGFINKKGEIIAPVGEYRNVGAMEPGVDLTYQYKNGLCLVWHWGKERWQGYIDTQGNIICKVKLDFKE